MEAALENTPVTYEELAELERDFEDVETEIIRQQVKLTAPLYARRHKTVSQIDNFWPLVLEQAPPDIDQYIQPSDSALLLSSLTSVVVKHFEIEDEAEVDKANADPRSVSIELQFAPNDYFEDTSLLKKFWYRRAKDGWCGLVSEPVQIHWKKGKDLTSGLLDLVCRAWETEQSTKQSSNGTAEGQKKNVSEEKKALKQKIEQTGMGGLSFFAWFGYVGRRISAQESAEATAKENEDRQRRKKGMNLDCPAEEEDDNQIEEDMSLEIFPDGDDLAVAFTEDLWPGAIKYFTQAQEQDALSEADFESDEEGFDESAEDEPPQKRQKS